MVKREECLSFLSKCPLFSSRESLVWRSPLYFFFFSKNRSQTSEKQTEAKGEALGRIWDSSPQRGFQPALFGVFRLNFTFIFRSTAAKSWDINLRLFLPSQVISSPFPWVVSDSASSPLQSHSSIFRLSNFDSCSLFFPHFVLHLYVNAFFVSSCCNYWDFSGKRSIQTNSLTLVGDWILTLGLEQ